MARHPLAALLVSLILIGAPQGAFAHASLVGSDPPDGTVLASAPSEIVLRFDEEVVPIRLRLVDTRGTEITPSWPPPAAASVLRAKYARDLLPEGAYFFSYRVTSADGHPIAGTIVFSVASAQAVRKSDGAGNSAVSSDWIIWAAAARWIFYLCAALAAGGVIFQLAVIDIPFALRPVLCSAAILGAFIALLQVGIRGALLLDGRAVELLGAAPWDESFATPLGLSLLLAAAGMAGCGVVLSLRRKKSPVLSLASIMFVLVSFPLSGHAATAAPRWLTGPALLIHVAAAMFWIGAFVPLRAVLNTSAPAPVVDRFSRIAIPAVLSLVIVGAAMAIVQVKRPLALIETSYGQLVTAKVLLFMALLGLAGWNRLRLSPALRAAAPGAVSHMRRIICMEALTGAAVLAVTAVLTLSAPPRIAPPPQNIILLQHIHARDLMADIEITPGKAGRNALSVALENPNGDRLTPREVWIEFSMPQAGIDPIRRRLTWNSSTKMWMTEGSELSVPGRWTLRLEVPVSDFEEAALETEIQVK